MKIKNIALGENITKEKYKEHFIKLLIEMSISLSKLYFADSGLNFKYMVFPFLSTDRNQKYYFLMSFNKQGDLKVPANTMLFNLYEESQIKEDIFKSYPVGLPMFLTQEDGIQDNERNNKKIYIPQNEYEAIS